MIELFTTSDGWTYFYLNGRFYCQRNTLFATETLTCTRADAQEEIEHQGLNLQQWQKRNCKKAGLEVE